MEDNKTFTGGLNTNFDEQNQPPNTYRDATNWIRLEDGSLTNEQGTVTVFDFPNSLTVKGSCVIEEQVILFCKGVGASEIGQITKDGNYETLTTIVDIPESSRIKAEFRINYKSERIVYYIDVINRNPARIVNIDDDAIPSGATLDEWTKLFLDSDLPIVKATGIGEDGNIPTGVYQFCARLLTASTNATTCSLLTNIVPIVNEFRSAGTEVYDGALPQTTANKSITLEVSNVDEKYSFVEIICLTYEGLTNTPKANVIGVVPRTGSTVTFKYTSLNQNQDELTLDELTVEPISYDSPKAITQKDSHLILGNLKTTNFDPELQQLANAIIIKYVIKEMSFTENISNVSQGSTAGDGIVTFNPVSTQFDNYKAELNTTDYTGYMRGEAYSFAFVPIYKNGSTGYAYHIPARNFPGVLSTPADTTSKVLGAVQSSVLYPSDLSLGYTGGGAPSPVRYHLMPTMKQEPIFDQATGKVRVLGIDVTNIEFNRVVPYTALSDIVGFIITRELRTSENKTILAQGIAQPCFPNIGDATKVRVTPFAGKLSGLGMKQAAFYSPETTIFHDDLSSATDIEPVASLVGHSDTNGAGYLVRDKRTGGINQEYAHMFMRYNVCDSYAVLDTTHNKQSIKAGSVGYVNAQGAAINIGTSTLKVEGTGSNGFVHFETNSNFNNFSNTSTFDLGGVANAFVEVDYIYHQGGTSEVRFYGLNNVTTGNIQRSLFNIIRLPIGCAYYGGVLDKEYIQIGYKLIPDLNDSTVSSLVCYGGDTFINKTGIVSTTNQQVANSGPTVYGDIEIRTLNYFWCESSVNTAYRHNIPNVTIPYFPAEKNISLSATSGANGILQYLPEYGHANGYNKQYSFQNITKKFFSKTTIPVTPVEFFKNRAIYSETAIEGEQFDAYRLFLTNNYHDVPKNKGEITNLFTHNSTLYIHTEQSLWKASFNEQVTQVSSAGEVALGNGGIFNRPSVEIFPTTGGYAGSVNPLATYTSPYGVYFVDGLQRKMFLLGSSFEELDYGIRFFLQDTLKWVTKSGTDNIANVVSTYDYKYDRWIVTINNQTDSESPVKVTLSFSSKLKTWTGLHSYIPTHMVSVGLKTFIGIDNEIAELNVGERGKYFGTLYPSSITIVGNENPTVAKTFDALDIDSNSAFTNIVVADSNKSIAKDLVDNDTWEFEPAANEQRITNKNSEWRVHFPVDAEETRIKGKWSTVKLDYDNLVNEKFIVKYINVKYRINAR